MRPLVTQVALKNYKSIRKCKVRMGPLTILVGPNGAGKSNFVDAMRLVSDSLRTTLDHAIRGRGGVEQVRRISGGHPHNFAIELKLDLYPETATFLFEIGSEKKGGFRVVRERAEIVSGDLLANSPEQRSTYEVRGGEIVQSTLDPFPPPKLTGDRLLLSLLSGIAEFRKLHDALAGMSFYNLDPQVMKPVQAHDNGEHLDRSGWNAAAVVRRMERDSPDTLDRIGHYLRRIVPGVEGVEHRDLGPVETLMFRQQMQNTQHPWRFFSSAMSDGTLRSLGVLLAIFQFSGSDREAAPFVAIEEPESTIHPGAATVVLEALIEASRREQILATTHSPEFLDHESIDPASLLAARNNRGETIIAPVEAAAVSAIQEGLMTAGELLRQDQLMPDVGKAETKLSQASLAFT